MKLSPEYHAWWKVMKRTKDGKTQHAANWRHGWRPDHLDVYYNWGPYAGFNFE